MEESCMTCDNGDGVGGCAYPICCIQFSEWKPIPVKMEWQLIETAPKDGSDIIVWHKRPQSEKYEGEGRLSTYGAHLDSCGPEEDDGVYIACFGGEYHESSDEYDPGFTIPSWWFVSDGDMERPLFPTHWMPLPLPPAGSP